MRDLSERFESKLWETAKTATAIGCSSHIFERMLRQHGGVQTAKRLIASGDIQNGFERLAELDRLDLSLEQIMLNPEFAPLFTPEELEAAKWRLDQIR